MGDRHMFFTTKDREPQIASTVDDLGDSYTRDITINELRNVSDIRGPRSIRRILMVGRF